jgi:hypothetical protein
MSSPAKEVSDRLRKEREAGLAFSDLGKWREEITRAHAAAIAEAERAYAAATTETERAHAAASTEVDLVLCLAMINFINEQFEEHVAAQQHDPEDLSELRKARHQYYMAFLAEEATIGNTSGQIDPRQMAAITRREVAAGRLSPDTDLHKLCTGLVARSDRFRTLLIPSRTSEQVGMAARLGVVLYWAGTLVACLIAGVIVYAVLFGTGKGDPLLQGLGLFVAAAIWLIGRATCYVLAGR